MCERHCRVCHTGSGRQTIYWVEIVFFFGLASEREYLDSDTPFIKSCFYRVSPRSAFFYGPSFHDRCRFGGFLFLSASFQVELEYFFFW